MFSFSPRERLIISYLWLVGSRLGGLYLASYVLDRVTDRTEVLIVTLAGMVYGALSLQMYSQQLSTYRLSRQIARITRGVEGANDTDTPANRGYEYGLAIDDASDYHNKTRMYIVMVASAIIIGLCFRRFASVLPFSIL